MKQAFYVFLSMAVFTPIVAPAETVDMLDHRINELMQQRDALRAELDACKQNTKKFKIAGIATLGATGLGVVGNVALHNKIQNMGGASKPVVGGAAVSEDDCAKSAICVWERECAEGTYDDTMPEWCVEDNLSATCCAAKGCPCTE